MQAVNQFSRLLITTFAFIVFLISARVVYTESWRHVFLIWNIFLAWIPYLLSKYFHQYQHKQKWKQLFLFGSWLLFFPNALYIVTDLVHLQNNGNAPLWFDVVLLFSSSVLGLMLAYASLHEAEKFIVKKFGKLKKRIIIPVIIFISSFGVYLGRFERWNSWDVIHDPLGLGANIANCLFFPFDNLRSWAVTVTLSGLFYIMYGFSRNFVVRK